MYASSYRIILRNALLPSTGMVVKYSTEALLNTAEAARFLRVSQASIRRWSDSGQLPSRRVGGRRERRFKESDLAAFLDFQATTNSASGVVVGGIAIAAPAHLATFYSTDTGLLRVTLPFLAEGLRLGEPC